jgi:outer membrane protein assembly factor BamB
MTTRTLPLLAACLTALAVPVLAADWPQWRGPDRTDISKETGLLKTWPKNGPTLLWTNSDAGVGYSGPAIVKNRLYTLGAFDKTEYLYALDVASGKRLWRTEIAPLYSNGYGDGPRCTPTVDGNLIYVLVAGAGNQGILACVTTDGKKVWTKSMVKDFGGRQMGGWGYSESPLVDGNQVICCPGGKQGHMVALDKKTGKLLWRCKEVTDMATYSSVIVAEVGGIRQYIQTTWTGSEGGIIGVSAKDGRLLWRVPRDGWRTAVVPTPIYHNNHVFVSAGYGAGCDLIKLTPTGKEIKAEKVYTNTNMVNHHGGVILVGDQLYGYSDRGGWVCMDFLSGKVIGSERRLPKGSLTCADGHLYCYSETDGTVVLVEASPNAWTEKGWKESGRFKIPQESKLPRKQGRIWTHPVVADGRLYLRDLDLIFCFDVKGAQ